MTYTRHGHHIPDSPTADERSMVPKARCGGVLLCHACRMDVIDARHPLLDSEHPFEDISEYDSDPDRFLKKAKSLVVSSHNNHIPDRSKMLTIEDLYIVWFAKTLGNWKALISTSKSGDGLYFEITHNGEKKETYVDTYVKTGNTKFTDEGTN